MTETGDLADAVRAGDRRALARAITLVESTRADHRADAVALLDAILPATGGATRVGISGAPGAGKSTFIEALGLHLVDAGHRVAVLAVDPSSARSGGSILGDKTRMEELSRRAEAFIRPSPSGGTLGGVARRTREAMLVCEAAGFDVVLVETVGVGQSRGRGRRHGRPVRAAARARRGRRAAGREARHRRARRPRRREQGRRRPRSTSARHTAADYAHALHLVRSTDDGAIDRVRTCSALLGDGIDELWETIERARGRGACLGRARRARRAEQARAWMWSEVTDTLLDELRSDAAVRTRIEALEDDVSGGRISPAAAAHQVLAAFRSQ